MQAGLLYQRTLTIIIEISIYTTFNLSKARDAFYEPTKHNIIYIDIDVSKELGKGDLIIKKMTEIKICGNKIISKTEITMERAPKNCDECQFSYYKEVYAGAQLGTVDRLYCRLLKELVYSADNSRYTNCILPEKFKNEIGDELLWKNYSGSIRSFPENADYSYEICNNGEIYHKPGHIPLKTIPVKNNNIEKMKKTAKAFCQKHYREAYCKQGE